jgi:hypothetical protein
VIRRKDKKGEIVPKEYWAPTTNPMALLHDMDRLFDEDGVGEHIPAADKTVG